MPPLGFLVSDLRCIQACPQRLQRVRYELSVLQRLLVTYAVDSHSCHPSHVCCIVPPHILQALATSDVVHPEAREAARTTLMLTETLRQDRHRNPRTRPTHVSFMPPFVLEHMANSESYPPELRTAARRRSTHLEVH